MEESQPAVGNRRPAITLEQPKSRCHPGVTIKSDLLKHVEIHMFILIGVERAQLSKINAHITL